MFISKHWLPLVAFVLAMAVYIMVRRNRSAEQSECYMIPFLAARSILWSAIIMVLINLLNTWFPGKYSDLQASNPTIPYITVLIVAPVNMFATLYAILRERRLSFCVDCRLRHGAVAERGLLGNLFCQESKYQLLLQFWMSVSVSAIAWIYYAVFYIDTDMNNVDTFIFRWIPVFMFAGSLGYLGMRYISMWQYYFQNVDGGIWGHGNYSILRYLIICGDHILLFEPKGDKRDGRIDNMHFDTPVKIKISYREQISDNDALDYFHNLSSLEDVKLRFLYINKNLNNDSNIFHYACFIEDQQLEDSRLKGDWYTLPQIQQLNSKKRVASALTAEIARIYTIAMAWKTYDNKGHRRYNIKHYKPIFRLRDLSKWDVDFNDSNWLAIARHNEDRPFYRLKRVWSKYIKGIGE
jgi:hypothetical protein